MNPLTEQLASVRITELQIEACRFRRARLARARSRNKR